MGNFPIQSSIWQVEVTSSRCTPILCNMEHAQFVAVSKVDNGQLNFTGGVILFMRDEELM